MSVESKTKPLIGLTCRFREDENWYYLPADYSRAVAAAGGIPVMIPLLPSAAAELAARLDAIVLCGSASDVDPARYGQGRHSEAKTVHPERDETDFRVLDEAFREKKPVLGICFGMQSLNVYLQGTLIQHIPDAFRGSLDHRNDSARHKVFLEPGSKIAGWAGGVRETVVNSTHHQSIENPGRGLQVAAQAPDGVIEAVEGDFPGHFVIGVQWHPERIWREEEILRRIFTELVRAATERLEIRKEMAGAEFRSPVVKSL